MKKARTVGRNADSDQTKNAVVPALEEEKNGGSSSSSVSQKMVWPKLEIELTKKEKEEDYLLIKGTRLPLRPKKRAKSVQRTLDLIFPGTWLCDISLARYEVKGKRPSKKKPSGLKAMRKLESESE